MDYHPWTPTRCWIPVLQTFIKFHWRSLILRIIPKECFIDFWQVLEIVEVATSGRQIAGWRAWRVSSSCRQRVSKSKYVGGTPTCFNPIQLSTWWCVRNFRGILTIERFIRGGCMCVYEEFEIDAGGGVHTCMDSSSLCTSSSSYSRKNRRSPSVFIASHGISWLLEASICLRNLRWCRKLWWHCLFLYVAKVSFAKSPRTTSHAYQSLLFG